jgi:hypothetical protein
MDLEYLGRSLNTRSYAAAETFGIESMLKDDPRLGAKS